jgi:hypothetical protein
MKLLFSIFLIISAQYSLASARIDCFKGALEIKLPVPSVGPRPKMDQKSAASLCSKIDSAIDSVTCFNEMMNVYVGGEAFDKDAAAILCANNF